MRVGHVVAGLEHDRVVRSEARERVDVRVGIVAFEIAVIEPQHALDVERVDEQRASSRRDSMSG